MLALVAITPAEAVRIHGDGRGAVWRGLPRGPILFGMSALFLSQAGHTAGGAFILEPARSIPFVPGACAAFDPVRGDPVRLNFVAKLGLAAGPVAGAGRIRASLRAGDHPVARVGDRRSGVVPVP